MPNLRDLLFGYEEGTAIVPGEFAVWNTDLNSNSNGGRCCLWTVPAGVTTAIFEIWGAGGGGGCSRFCQSGSGGGSGGYGIKACTVAAGQQIRICAGGSGCCSESCSGTRGCCSFVCSTGGGGQSTWEAKVCGGEPNATMNCCGFSQCYTCCTMCYCCGGRSSNTDFCVAGTIGGYRATQYCLGEGYHWKATAPFMPGPLIGPNGCCAGGGCMMRGMWPGGGGGSAQSSGGNCCCGGWGAGGLVYVVYF